MPSRAYTSFLPDVPLFLQETDIPGFNALSGLYLISTRRAAVFTRDRYTWFQCPLGLIPHFYGTPSKT